jgi:hypothetical protein
MALTFSYLYQGDCCFQEIKSSEGCKVNGKRKDIINVNGDVNGDAGSKTTFLYEN